MFYTLTDPIDQCIDTDINDRKSKECLSKSHVPPLFFYLTIASKCLSYLSSLIETPLTPADSEESVALKYASSTRGYINSNIR